MILGRCCAATAGNNRGCIWLHQDLNLPISRNPWKSLIVLWKSMEIHLNLPISGQYSHDVRRKNHGETCHLRLPRHWSGTHAWTWHEVPRPGDHWGPTHRSLFGWACLAMSVSNDRFYMILLYIFNISFLFHPKWISLVSWKQSLRVGAKQLWTSEEMYHFIVMIYQGASYPYLNLSMCRQINNWHGPDILLQKLGADGLVVGGATTFNPEV